MKNIELYYIATFLALFFVVILFALVLPKVRQNNANVASITPTPSLSEVNITSPVANSTVSSPVLVSGTINRNWTFEATFAIEITDNNSKSLVTTPVGVIFPNETAEFGNFSVSIPFKTTAPNGFIIIHNDNPSGLPQNAKTYKIPIKFSSTPTPTVDISTWKTYLNDKYGFQFKYPSDLTLKSTDSNYLELKRNNGSNYSQVVVISGPNCFELKPSDSINGYSTCTANNPPQYPNDPSAFVVVELNDKKSSAVQFVFYGISSLNDSTKQLLSTFKFTTESPLNTMKVKIYQVPKDVSESCESKDFIEVDLPKSSTPLKDSISYLISQLKNTKNFRLISAVINNGVATLKFDDPNFYTTGGSCHVQALSSQIEKTALQFPTVKSVKFSGPEHLFQP